MLYKEEKGLGGRPSNDYLLMLKIAILQQIYNISDDNTEYLINDRISFQRFLGMSINLVKNFMKSTGKPQTT
ncbi:MAG: transposase [Endomicrobium sp.]|nr:transposase [Endomicrobium sp.]